MLGNSVYALTSFCLFIFVCYKLLYLVMFFIVLSRYIFHEDLYAKVSAYYALEYTIAKKCKFLQRVVK